MRIQCLAEDKDGFIWAGTPNGLYRFDAHGFKHYKAIQNDSTGLSENNIISLYVTHDNQLWIGTERKGVVWFDKENDRFVAIKNDANKLNNITPSEFAEDETGNLWFANKGGAPALGCIKTYSHTISYFYVPVNLVHGRGQNGLSLSLTSSGNIYLGSTDGFLFFNAHKRLFEYNDLKSIEHHDEYTITKQIRSVDNSIWLCLYGFGLLHYFPSTKRIEKFHVPKEIPYGNVLMIPYKKDVFLVYAGQKNLYLFDTRKGLYTELNDVSKDYEGGYFNVCSMIISKEGIIYLGGAKGLFTLDTKNQPSLLITIPGLAPTKNFKLNSILYNPSDSCYYAGLFMVNEYSILKWHKNTFRKTTYSSVSHPYLKQYINKLQTDSKGVVWANDYNHIYYINPVTQKLVSVFQTTQYPGQLISDFFIDKQNRIWLTLTRSGLAMLNEKYSIDRTYLYSNKQAGPVNYSIIGQDSTQRIWISRHMGLSSFDPASASFTQYTLDDSNEIVTNAIAGSGNTLWLTKYGKGIYHFAPQTGQYRVYTEANGLGSNLFANNAISLTRKHLWTLSSSYLSCLDINTHQFQNYSGNDLYDFHTINTDNTFMISPDNELIAATTHGIIINKLANFTKANNQPHAFINSIKVWGKDWVENKDLNAVNTISLNHDQNYLSLGFSSLSFRQDEANQYSYFLDGFDKEWHTTTTEKQVTYTSLPSGTYTFNIKASNYAGVWDVAPKQITIIIHPPFWQTWWFIGIVILTILTISYIIVLAKINAVKAKAKLENQHNIELMEFELKALKAQINPHFLFNALSAIQQQIFSQNTTDAHKYLGKFAKLLRSTLDLSDSRSIQLVDEIELLKNYLELEKVRFKNKFTFNILVDDALLAENPDIPGMIVQPYIENAIIHGLLNLDTGKEGILSVHFASGHKSIQCTITDNGVGRKKAGIIKQAKGKTHVSKGMAITENRINLIAKLYNGKATSTIVDLFDAANEPCGTKVVLHIPLYLHTLKTENE